MNPEQVFDAITLGPEPSAPKHIDEDFAGGGLIAADEMVGEADTADGQL